MTALSKAAGRFSETTIDGEVVVMSLDSGDFFSLTGTAGEIWELIDGSRSAAEIGVVLAARYRVDQAGIADEVEDFVGQLLAARLLAAR